jgi:hypothetical protein
MQYCETKKPQCLGLMAMTFGGAARSRTGLAGFAIRYITALLPRPTSLFLSVAVKLAGPTNLAYHLKILSAQILSTTTDYSNKKGQHFEVLPFELEREKRLELSTYTLARYRSTN